MAEVKPYYEDNHIKIFNKDCRSMNEIANNSIQCVVTSPPYWGLRKYSGVSDLIWGDNKDCEHQWQTTSCPTKVGKQGMTETDKWPAVVNNSKPDNSNICSLCGAWKGSYGLEPTPEMYIQHTIEILREIRRVLRKDGVVFWNIGDSYATKPTGSYGTKSGLHGAQTSDKYKQTINEVYTKRFDTIKSGLKPKDLCLIPFRVAISAQSDGWWARSVIIWSKPNPMPESVTDRPTESHEYILMLTKSAKYYWDADAVREKADELTRGASSFRNDRYVGNEVFDKHDKFTGKRIAKDGEPDYGRNIRSVWEFPTQPYPEAHFAVFPEKLPEICIKAATPEEGCCSKCGAPWERIVERQNVSTYEEIKQSTGKDYHDSIKLTEPRGVALSGGQKSVGNTLTPEGKVPWYNKPDNITLGWQPTCKCNADKSQSIVLDPFAGAGTALWVAKRLNRKAIGYELSQEYCELALNRNRQQVFI